MNIQTNYDTITKALPKALTLIHGALQEKFKILGEELIEHALQEREYHSFTGNTVTSLAFGLYRNNSLKFVVFLSNLRPPVRVKIENGDKVFLSEPHEGEARSVSGKVDVDHKYGYESSIALLEEVRPHGGDGIVVTTGTEYSEFLENEKGLNVLSATELLARIYALEFISNSISRNKSIEKV